MAVRFKELFGLGSVVDEAIERAASLGRDEAPASWGRYRDLRLENGDCPFFRVNGYSSTNVMRNSGTRPRFWSRTASESASARSAARRAVSIPSAKLRMGPMTRLPKDAPGTRALPHFRAASERILGICRLGPRADNVRRHNPKTEEDSS